MNPDTAFRVVACVLAAAVVGYLFDPYLALAFLAAGALIAASLKMANLWQKLVVLRMGKLRGVEGCARRLAWRSVHSPGQRVRVEYR